MAKSTKNQHNRITIGDGIRFGIGLFIAGLIPWILFMALGATGVIATLLTQGS